MCVGGGGGKKEKSKENQKKNIKLQDGIFAKEFSCPKKSAYRATEKDARGALNSSHGNVESLRPIVEASNRGAVEKDGRKRTAAIGPQHRQNIVAVAR